MRYYKEAYGCTMNQGETDMLAEQMKSQGHIEVDDPENADVAIIGTCIVITKTEERMKRRIAELSELCSSVRVTGCLPNGRPEESKKISSNVEMVYPGSITMSECPGKNLIGILPIATGCVGDCAYCITKLARGSLRSRSIEEIVTRFRELLNAGTIEVLLTCQDTASYGRDKDLDLPTLMRELSKFEGHHRVRVGMMNPDTVRPSLDEIIDAMENQCFYRFLHLPLQSGSDAVLGSMGRKYSVDQWKETVSLFRKAFPDITLSTDVIAGFPGESEDDFRETLRVLKETKPDILNITRFSPRPGTRANDMDGKVHSRVKKRRSKELTTVHKKISRDINRKYLGRREQVLFLEKGKGDTIKGRMNNYKVVVAEGEPEELLGSWKEVEITGAGDVYLRGDLI